MTDTLDPRSWLYPTPRGLYCKPGDFYIDPAVAVPQAVVTHGHGDHARPGHRKALATPETLAIMRARFEGMPDTGQQPLKYGESLRIGEVDVELSPATSSPRPAPPPPPSEPIPCDVFITEATFALPVFHHPSDMGEIGKLLR